MRIGVVILPEYRWPEAATIWQRVEELGFEHAWTFDHLAWRDLRDGPWFSAVPVLSAVAAITRRIQLGIFVATPNFRHPVLLAKESVAIEHISAGRFVLGLGSGAPGLDSTMLGQPTMDPGDRADRFEEFVTLVDRLLRNPVTTARGRHYDAVEARVIPGCVRSPRLPLAIAATGRRGLRLAARIADIWITNGDPARLGLDTEEQAVTAVAGQVRRLDEECARVDRPGGGPRRLVDLGRVAARPMRSTEAFLDLVSRYAELGFTDAVVHYPRGSGVFAERPDALERIAVEALPVLRGPSSA